MFVNFYASNSNQVYKSPSLYTHLSDVVDTDIKLVAFLNEGVEGSARLKRHFSDLKKSYAKLLHCRSFVHLKLTLVN